MSRSLLSNARWKLRSTALPSAARLWTPEPGATALYSSLCSWYFVGTQGAECWLCKEELQGSRRLTLPFLLRVPPLKGPLEIVWCKCWFYRRGSWGPRGKSHVPKVTQLESSRTETTVQSPGCGASVLSTALWHSLLVSQPPLTSVGDTDKSPPDQPPFKTSSVWVQKSAII